jgi:hypothetical protein
MKNIVKLCLSAFLLIFLTFASNRLAYSGNHSTLLSETVAEAPTGLGTLDEPYLISTLANLKWLSENSAHWNKHFLQTADINATETATWNDGTGWNPIGLENTCFSGVYNGGGFKIEGIFINRPDNSYLGLFGCISLNATISNLGLVDVNITGKNYIGSLAGSTWQITVSNCYSTGVISAVDYAGGLIGSADFSTIKNSYSSTNVSGSLYIAGLIGHSGWNTDIDGCFARGNITADIFSAGFIGRAYYTNIKNSYSHGNVTSNTSGSGFIGIVHNSEVVNCYSTGKVTGTDKQGFIFSENGLKIKGSFWDTEASEVTEDQFAEAKTTVQMNDFSTFITKGWEFKGTGSNKVWNIGNGRNNGYPYHDWQFPDDEAPGLPHLPYYELLSVVNVVKEGAEVNLRVILMGDPEIVEFGACVSSSSEPPTIDDLTYMITIDGPGEFNLLMGDLEANTTYQVRLFAKNGDDVVNYSQQLSFHTLAIDPVQPEGIGTQANPYLISSLAELLWIRENPQHWNKFYRQTADINASETANWNAGEGWRPIGIDFTSAFNGEYDGGNFIISDLTINRPGSNYQGLFGYISRNNNNGKVYNLGLTNVNITGHSFVGALAGTSSAPVNNCYSSGDIFGDDNTGGLLGSFIGSRIYQSYSNCNVTSRGKSGGLVGNISSSNSLVSQCYATGQVTANRGGGLVGRIWYSNIENSYSTGNVSTSVHGGGLVAILDYSTIKNSYSTGKVIGSESFGGLVYSYYQGEAIASFWDTEASENANSAVGEGHTTNEMKDINTFHASHWGFKSIGTEEIWNIGNGRNDGYPYLIWQFPADEFDLVPVLATVITKTPENIEATSAIISARLFSPGNPETTEWGLIWGTNDSLTMEEATKEIQLLENPEFSVELINLEPNTTYYFRAFATNEVGTILGKEISLTTLDADAISLCKSLDNCDLRFSSGGNTSWFGQDSITSDSEDAAQSGILNEYNHSTWFETSVDGYGEVIFKWKIEAQTWDTLEVVLNNQRISYIRGTTDWESISFFTGMGSNTIRWVLKRGSWSGNATAWVDMVTFEEISCPQPDTISFSKLTDTSAKVDWTVIGAENEWQMEWGPVGFTQGEGNMINGLESPSHFLTGLDPGVSYDVYVRTVCDSENSRWTGPETLSTIDVYPSCAYKFILLDSWGDGWNGATMQIIQDDVVIHTFGSGFTTGKNYQEFFNFDLGVEFKVLWNNGGNFAHEVGLKILSPDGSIIYHMENIGTSNVGTNIFSFSSACSLHTYSLLYLTDNNGHIEGLSEQLIEYGSDASEVTAMPATGYYFVQWSDGRIENPRIDQNVVIDLTVTAEFAINSYTLNYHSGENGQIQGDTIQTINHGSDATAITAVPDTGYHFVKWDDENTDNPRTDVNVTDQITVSAIFAINSYIVQYNSDENGKIEGEATQTIIHGSDATAITAVPDIGYHFVKWDDENTDNPRTDVNVTDQITVSAIFAINSYIVQYYSNENGKIEGEATQTINHGSDATAITAVPDTGYHFIKWDDESTDNPRTDKNVTTEFSVTATFGLSVYPLTIKLNIDGSGATEGSGEYHYGDDVTVKATPATGYRFINWTCDAQNILSTEATYSFKMIADAYNINANFESTTGLDQREPMLLRVFPNPAREQVTISSPTMLQEVIITDISGRMVSMNKDLNLNEFVVKTNAYMPGIYFIRIVADGITTVRKINVVQ